MNSGKDLGRKLNWRQACDVLGCSRSFFYNLVNTGLLPSRRYGRVKGIWVYERDCLEYLARTSSCVESGQNHV